MRFEKYENSITYWSDIHFNDEECFCGKPYVSLTLFTKQLPPHDIGTILIGIHDNDDFDIGLKYIPDIDNFAEIYNCLRNWMRKKEKEVSNYDDIWKPFEFFPDCNCERIMWC